MHSFSVSVIFFNFVAGMQKNCIEMCVGVPGLRTAANFYVLERQISRYSSAAKKSEKLQILC